MEKSYRNKEPIVIEVTELSHKNRLDKKAGFARRALAITVGGLALFAGAVKASSEFDNSKGNYTLAITDTLPPDTTQTSIETTTTNALDTTTPVDIIDTTDPNVGTTTPVDIIDTTDPNVGTTTPVDTTNPPSQETTTTIKYVYQDVYGDVCIPLGWVNCAEYNVYDEFGNLTGHFIANSDWSEQYIVESGGGGVNGYAVKVRDILPCPPEECVSYK